MTLSEDRAPVWAIWLLIVFSVVQPVAWTIAVGLPQRGFVLVALAVVWFILVLLAAVATGRIRYLRRQVTQGESAHLATLTEIEQLQTQNAILDIIARSVDVPLAFMALATRIARLVPCDRVGLALLSEDRQEFQTYTARVQEQERRSRPRPEVVFKVDRTIIGSVVRSREPLIVANLREAAPDFLDANILVTSGFASALIVPLLSRDRAVGTLNVVSRTGAAFVPEHAIALQPIAEILGVAWIAQQLQVSLARYETMEAMSELTLSVSSEINSALQTIIGHCDLLERGYPDPNLHRDLSTVVRQAQRISTLLDKMRTAARDRLRAVADTVTQGNMEADTTADDREIT